MLYILKYLVLCFCSYVQALLVYWCTNNALSLCQVALLRPKKVRQYFKIPEPVDHNSKQAGAGLGKKLVSLKDKEGFSLKKMPRTVVKLFDEQKEKFKNRRLEKKTTAFTLHCTS